MVDNYFKSLFQLIPKPFETIRTVKESDKKTRYALYSLLIFSALAMTNMMLYQLEGLFYEEFPPLIPVTPELVWITSFFFMLPIALLGAILFAGIVQLISKPLGGKGTFEGQFALFLFAYPFYFMFLHIIKTIGFFIYRVSIGGWLLFIFVFLAFYITVIVVKVEHDLNWNKTILISALGYGVVALFSMTYIR